MPREVRESEGCAGNLVRLRQEMELSASELCRLIGINKATLWYIERRVYLPSCRVSKKLDAFFNLPAGTFEWLRECDEKNSSGDKRVRTIPYSQEENQRYFEKTGKVRKEKKRRAKASELGQKEKRRSSLLQSNEEVGEKYTTTAPGGYSLEKWQQITETDQ